MRDVDIFHQFQDQWHWLCIQQWVHFDPQVTVVPTLGWWSGNSVLCHWTSMEAHWVLWKTDGVKLVSTKSIEGLHKCIHKRVPTYLHEKFIKQSDMGYSRTRGASKLYLHRPRTDFYKNIFEYSGAKLWNSLPASVRDVTSKLGFSHALQHYYNSS